MQDLDIDLLYEEVAIDPKRRYLCRHIHSEGHRCGSPSLRGESLCYYHERSRRTTPIVGKSSHFDMPRINDRATIQIALHEILNRLATGGIDPKRGALLLYGLQIASANLPRHTKTAAELPPQVEIVIDDVYFGDLAPVLEIPTPEPEILTPEQKELTPPAEPATLELQTSRLELEPCTSHLEPSAEPSTPPTHASLTPYNNHNDFAYSGLPDSPRALPLSG